LAIDSALRELLSTGARELGLTLTKDQLDACFLFHSELKKWNRKINLTAIDDDREIIIKHFLDSFSYLQGFNAAPGQTLLDLGSGAGFPALPLKIVCPGLSITMVESVKKKASFLRHMIRTLGVQNTAVVDQRTETMPASYLKTFDIVTARAFADMETALSQGVRFLKPEGLMVLSRGPEETVSDAVLGASGMALVKRTAFSLPGTDYRRALWVFQRTG